MRPMRRNIIPVFLHCRQIQGSDEEVKEQQPSASVPFHYKGQLGTVAAAGRFSNFEPRGMGMKGEWEGGT